MDSKLAVPHNSHSVLSNLTITRPNFTYCRPERTPKRASPSFNILRIVKTVRRCVDDRRHDNVIPVHNPNQETPKRSIGKGF